MNLRRSRRLIAWIACLAILAAGFMPSLTYALAAQGSAHAAGPSAQTAHPEEHEFCGEEAAPETKHAPSHQLHHGAHCPFCLLHLDAVAPPPCAADVAPVAALPRLLPPAFLHARVSSTVWLAAQPRAPPSSL
ncbi:DUF2946 domain-containing protein [Noviherbaspirillum pedocola]|uniref:DUF2946 domain-containing protein n=1 Tax=Noviherbaspirillum pedocola TaxID=2801341 RepID=A0A934SU79_9BURK|nr:DUF2946 domain-containing protein [Noviherbaspirillum pedocola]MBK4735802.1 DUF2946 domain-containing protein [Noviherbaspirillum pedocola]